MTASTISKKTERIAACSGSQNSKLTCLLFCFYLLWATTATAARCDGSTTCSACSDCSKCYHCTHGGSCGVCASGYVGRAPYSSSSSPSHSSSGGYSTANRTPSGSAYFILAIFCGVLALPIILPCYFWLAGKFEKKPPKQEPPK